MSKNSSRRKLSERISLLIAKSPDKSVLLLILLFNITFFLVAAFIISRLAPETLADRGFWPSVFYTVTMILDAGCISFVVESVGQTSVTVIIICLLIVLIGMVTFTGAVVGYVTNYISSFIENSNAGKRKLKISDHIIILGWNSRGAEIITDYIYTKQTEDVIVLVRQGKKEIEEEINNRITNTIQAENEKILEKLGDKRLGYFEKRRFLKKNGVKRNVSVIVREGDILSKAQLDNVSIEKAQTIIILGKDYQNGKKYNSENASVVKKMKGNSSVIKTLIMVAEIAGSEESANDQKIIVEVADEWTRELAQQVLENKERLGKSNIILMPVNHTLGQLLSQLSIMPELTQVYRELFSNKGAFFTSMRYEGDMSDSSIQQYMAEYLQCHEKAIPVSVMSAKEGNVSFFLCDDIDDLMEYSDQIIANMSVKLKPKYEIGKKNIVILGHNSAMNTLMNGFDAFQNEWKYEDGSDVLNIIVIDDETSLAKHGYYEEYPYVNEVIPAEIYDKKLIYDTLSGFAKRCEGDISVLILSDDLVPNENIDEEPLTYLMYMDDLLKKGSHENAAFDPKRYNIIVEILEPQNYDAIQGYNPNHVVITNQYLSRMITQSSEHEAITTFYRDILTFDDPLLGTNSSKELYLKRVEKLFEVIPEECTAGQLIRAVFHASPNDNKMVAIGLFRDKKHTLFVGENANMKVKLQPGDKLIICSDH